MNKYFTDTGKMFECVSSAYGRIYTATDGALKLKKLIPRI